LAPPEPGVANILQVAYYRGPLVTRARMLESRGHHVTSVLGNDEAFRLDAAVIAAADSIVIGFSAPYPVRAAMIHWFKQLGEHLLCKHAFISLKSLNRRLLTVQTPLLFGLLIGLQVIRCPSKMDSIRVERAQSEERPRLAFLPSPDASVFRAIQVVCAITAAS